MVCFSYENNNIGNMAWIILKVSPEMAELILARFLEWVLKVNPPPDEFFCDHAQYIAFPSACLRAIAETFGAAHGCYACEMP